MQLPDELVKLAGAAQRKVPGPQKADEEHDNDGQADAKGNEN